MPSNTVYIIFGFLAVTSLFRLCIWMSKDSAKDEMEERRDNTSSYNLAYENNCNLPVAQPVQPVSNAEEVNTLDVVEIDVMARPNRVN